MTREACMISRLPRFPLSFLGFAFFLFPRTGINQQAVNHPAESHIFQNTLILAFAIAVALVNPQSHSCLPLKAAKHSHHPHAFSTKPLASSP